MLRSLPLSGAIKAKFALAFISALTPAVILEGAARLFAPPTPINITPGLTPNEIEDVHLLWKNRPGYSGDPLYGPINSAGFRGVDEAVEGAERPFRILSLGESTTFGYKVGWRDTYSSRLEENLRGAGRNVRVLNAGTRGWTTLQSVRFLSMEIDSIKPDLVLFCHELNDFLPTTFRDIRMPGAALTDREVIQLTEKSGWFHRLVRKSRFLTAARCALARSQATAAGRRIARLTHRDVLHSGPIPYDEIANTSPGAEKPWMENRNPLVRVPDPEREAALRLLVRLTRERHVPLVLLHPAYPVSRRHRCVQTKVALEEGIPLLDVEDVLASDAAANGRKKSDYFFAYDQFHLNGTGHAVVAEALAGFLVRERLVPDPAEVLAVR